MAYSGATLRAVEEELGDGSLHLYKQAQCRVGGTLLSLSKGSGPQSRGKPHGRSLFSLIPLLPLSCSLGLTGWLGAANGSMQLPQSQPQHFPSSETASRTALTG